jgi:GNAT superfamily N-acetyltransferase
VHVYSTPVGDGETRPVAYTASQWEYAKEVEEAETNSQEALSAYDRGELTRADMEPPSTLDMRNWLEFTAALNRARAKAYWELGDGYEDVLICRELHAFPILSWYSYAPAGILQLFVHPEYERQGYGAKLMVKICKAMDEHQAHGFVLAPRDAVAFYSLFGFTPGVSFRIIDGKFSGGLVGMVRKPFERRIPSALPNTGPSQSQASEETGPEPRNTPSTEKALGADRVEKLKYIESEIVKAMVLIFAKVGEAQIRGAAFSASEIQQIIELSLQGSKLGNKIESLRTQKHDAVDEAIKRVTAIKVMKTIKRLEGKQSESEPGDVEASRDDIAMQCEETMKVVRAKFEEFK